jgi:hypothetical protein
MATLSLKAALRPDLASPPDYVGVFGDTRISGT